MTDFTQFLFRSASKQNPQSVSEALTADNPALAPGGVSAIQLAGEPLHPLLAQIAIVGRYIGMSVAPLIVSIILWAVLNPNGREALLGQIEAEP